MSKSIKIGSRKSLLARLQSYLTAAALKEKFPDISVEFYFKESMGDKDLVTPLWQMGDRGVFTRDFVEDLRNGTVDVVIHSWKDLDLKDNEGTKILSILPRADQRDLLLFKKESFEKFSSDEVTIFSSSPRREYNLTRLFAEILPARMQNKKIRFETIRGNISTRLRKWMESDLHGIIVAKAALDRLLVQDFPESSGDDYAEARAEIRKALDASLFMCLPLSENPNAPAQGALAAEIRDDRGDLDEIFNAIRDEKCDVAVRRERNILKKYGGGCHQKIGVAALERDYGSVTFVKGLTDDGVVLDGREVSAVYRNEKANDAGRMWPDKKSPMKFKRKPLAVSGVNQDIWVSRSNAWPDDWQNGQGIVWAAGLKTMKDLAAKDVWVHGSSDALGEKEDPAVDILLGRKADFVKLTHSLSGNIQSDIDRLYSYELELEGEIPLLDGKTHFFWMSGHQFDIVFEKNPGIAGKFHSCGPGITRDHILKRLGEDAKLDVFLKFEDWMDYHLS